MTPAPAARPPAATAQPLGLLDEGPACRILVVGDSMAQQLQGPLNQALRASGAGQAFGAGAPATGLARLDYTERTNGQHWIQRAGMLLDRGIERGEPFVAMLVFLGTNDRQDLSFLPEPNTPRRRDIQWGSAGHAPEYGARVRGMAEQARERTAALVWLGMPRTGQRRHDAGMLALNAIARDALAEVEEAHFLDLAAMTATQAGEYDAHVFDAARHAARLRGADNIHFNMAGNRVLARWVAAQLTPILAGLVEAGRCAAADTGGATARAD